MDERGTESKLCKKELRKQKLIDYLAAKGKLKPSNPRPYLRDAQVMKPTMCAVNKDMTMGKENQGLPNTLKMNKETVKVQPLTVKAVSQTTLRSTTNKQSTNATLRTLSAVSATARHTAAKGTAQNTAPSRTASLKAAPVRPLTTAPIKASLGASDRHRAQSNMAVKVAARLNSGKAPQPNIGKPSNTIHTRPRTALNSVRMSLGTHAQTKTGLIPALVQPRNTQSKTTVPAPTATSATTFAPNRTQLSTTIPVSGPQKTVIAQRKPRSTTVVSKTVQRRTTTVANAKMKSQAPNRTDTKPLTVKPLQPPRQRQLNQPPKPTHGPTGPTAAATKPGENRRGAQTTKNTRVLTQVMEPVRQASPQRRSVLRGAGGATRTWMPASRAFTGTGSQWQSKALSRAVRAAVAELGQKDSGSLAVTEENSGAEIGTGDIVTETNAPTTDLSSSPPCHRGTHRTGEIPPMNMAQTVPRSGRNANQVGWSTALKTPRVQTRVMPQTEQGKNKMTAAQEDRMRKLQEWREARGISYKRPPMPVRPRVRRTVALPQPYWASMEMEDEADSLICAVDRSLADCMKLLEEGCLSKQVQDVLSKVPMAQKFSKYWICQARLMERQGNLEVLPLFEEAVRVVLEPVDELRTVVFEILKKKETQGQSPMPLDAEREEEKEGLQDPMATPKAFKALICGDKGDSSVVKYKITATPGGFRSQQREPVRLDGQEVRFFTPVRRSVRIDRASLRYPTSLQEHDPCVASYKDLVAQEESEREGEEWKDAEGEGTLTVYNTPLYIYRENEALRDQVHVQLVYDQD